MEKKLYRSDTNKIVSGVCGGLGEYFDVDPTLVRIVLIILTLATGVFLFGYLLAWIIVPKREPGSWQQESTDSINVSNTGQQTPQQYSSWTRYLPGLILILIGVILLFQDTFYWFDLEEFWPLVLIIIGVAMIVGRSARKRARLKSEYNNSTSTDNGGTSS